MKFSVASALAFAAAVLAQPRFLNADFQVEEGEPFTLRWGNAVGPVTITLMTGDPENLQEVTVITSGETGSEYTFTPSDWPSGTYAFRIEDSTDEPNYSERFQYTGTGEFTTTSTARTTTRTSTRTSSSSSSTESSSTSTETSTTSSSATTSTTTTTRTTAATTRTPTPTTAPDNTNAGQRFVSPLALVLGTVAALVFFN